jgi:hypothetical protein
MPKKLSTYFILLLFLMPFVVFSQKETAKKKGYSEKMNNFRVKKKDFKKYRYLSAGGSINFLTYFGDLAPTENFLSTELSLIKPGISAFVQYRYSPRMSLKGELLYGRLTGDDFTSADPNDPLAKGRYIRNLSFRNDILDLSVMSQLNIFKNYMDYRQRRAFNIYVSGGISIFYHNPKAKVTDFKISGERYPNSGEWVALRPLGTEGQMSEHYDYKTYSSVQFSIPFGGGFNFYLNERIDFTFEINYRILLTDYIDDVSGNYVDLGALDSDMAKSMSDRSREQYAVMAGVERDEELILANTEPFSYASKYENARYNVFRGYGEDITGARRGGSSNDTYIITSFKISYILNRAKPRNN